MNRSQTTALIEEQHQPTLRDQGRAVVASRSDWADRVRIAVLEPSDADAVFAMLSHCSPATRYSRFHGVTDGISHVRQLLTDVGGQDALGAWNGPCCVGLASMAFDRDGSAHIGVVVEDRCQRQGVGTALMMAFVAQARLLRLSSLVADVLADNQFILPLLARIGPITATVGYGSYRVHVGLEVDAPRRDQRPNTSWQTARNLAPPHDPPRRSPGRAITRSQDEDVQ